MAEDYARRDDNDSSRERHFVNYILELQDRQVGREERCQLFRNLGDTVIYAMSWAALLGHPRGHAFFLPQQSRGTPSKSSCAAYSTLSALPYLQKHLR